MEHDEDEEPPLAVQIQRDDDQSISQQSSVGVTLITGYLGSGKSTVIFIKINTPSFVPFLISNWVLQSCVLFHFHFLFVIGSHTCCLLVLVFEVTVFK